MLSISLLMVVVEVSTVCKQIKNLPKLLSTATKPKKLFVPPMVGYTSGDIEVSERNKPQQGVEGRLKLQMCFVALEAGQAEKSRDPSRHQCEAFMSAGSQYSLA